MTGDERALEKQDAICDSAEALVAAYEAAGRGDSPAAHRARSLVLAECAYRKTLRRRVQRQRGKSSG